MWNSSTGGVLRLWTLWCLVAGPGCLASQQQHAVRRRRRQLKDNKGASGITKTQDGAGCLARLDDGSIRTFADGDALVVGQGPDAVSLVGNSCRFPQYYPCYCDMTETSGIRCPYCTFPEASTMGPGEACVNEGDTIVFTAWGDRAQQCTCEYLGGGSVQKQCEDFDPDREPPTSAPAEDRDGGDGGLVNPLCSGYNTEYCPSGLIDTVPDTCGPDDCYTFCDGRFAGCCAPGSTGCYWSDTHRCQTIGTGVAPILSMGCRRPPDPTASPTPPPVQTANPTPTPTPPTPPTPGPTEEIDDRTGTCLAYGTPCTTSPECCSLRCVVTCVRPFQGVEGRTRLGDSQSRGGAAAVARTSGGGGGGINVGTP